MEKVLAIGATTVKLQAARPQRPPSPGAPALAGGADTALSSTVLFVEISDFAARPVAEQLLLKQSLNGHVACALEGVDAARRIVLETEAGLALSFLGSPFDALTVLQALLSNIAHGGDRGARLRVHGAINLGPVRVAHETGGHVNIVGDGINVAQRLLSFAKDGQILLARSFVEAILTIDAAHARLFVYQGSRTDAQVRDHEVFELDLAALARTQLTRAAPAAANAPAPAAAATPRRTGRRLAYGFAALSLVALAGAALSFLHDAGDGVPVPRTAMPRTTLPAAKTRPAAEARPAVAVTATASPAPQAIQPPVAPSAADDDNPAAERASAAALPSDKESASSSPLRVRPRAVAKHAPAHRVRTATKADAHAHPATSGPAAVEERPAAGAREPAGTPPWRMADSAWPGAAPEPVPAVKPGGSAPANALITLAISPWGEVFVDGRSVGVSPPLREFELPTGRHRVVVRNGDLKAYEQELELSSNQTLRIKHKFAERS